MAPLKLQVVLAGIILLCVFEALAVQPSTECDNIALCIEKLDKFVNDAKAHFPIAGQLNLEMCNQRPYQVENSSAAQIARRFALLQY